MLLTTNLILFVLAVTWWLWSRRNRYGVLRINSTGPVKAQIVTLSCRGIQHARLRTEIKIFNRLHLVMPTVHGVAVAYQQQLAALLKDTNYHLAPDADAYDKLFYGYACAVLLRKPITPLAARRLRRHLCFLFAPARKIVKRITPVWSRQVYSVRPVPVYKIFQQGYIDPRQPAFFTAAPVHLTVLDSYLKYQNADLTIKQYANCYELSAASEQTFTLQIAADKADYNCTVARGVVTCKNLVNGQIMVYRCQGAQIRLATSVCEPIDALRLYLTWQGTARVSINGGTARLLTPDEIAANQAVEKIVNAAYAAKFIRGEKLRVRYQAAQKCVPSLAWLTKVVAVTAPADFFAVLDQLSAYQRAAQLFHGFNLVFLYASTNPLVADLVAGFLSRATVAQCRAQQLLIFFIDRTTTEPDALYFFTKMTQAHHYVPAAPLPAGVKVAKTFPEVRTLVLSNPQPQPTTLNVVWPLLFTRPHVVTAQGQLLTAVNLTTGKAQTYQLPVTYHLPHEWLTTHVNLPLKVRLLGFEQKTLTLTRHEQAIPYRERRQHFFATLSDIVVTSRDHQLAALFAKPVQADADPALLNLVKSAYKNVDRKLLLTILGDKHALPSDVWQYLLVKLVGLRYRQGKIHLTPCINIMGEFQLSFVSAGQKFTFNTTKDLPTSKKIAIIEHG